MGRRRTGGIEDRNGRRYARVTVEFEDGRKVRRRLPLDTTLPKREARKVARQLSDQATGYVFVPKRGGLAAPPAGPSMTVDEYHGQWATDRERRGRVSERGRYTSHIAPLLGKLPIRSITKDHARALSADLDEKVLAGSSHWSTAIKVWGVATKMFADSADHKVAALRVLDATPFAGVRGPDRGERKSKQWLYPREALALLGSDDVPLR